MKHALLLALLASPALADERFALVIGANTGWSNDRPLRHAETDAQRMAAVLLELGQFEADHVTLLRDPDTSEVRAKLSAMAKAAKGLPQSLVYVYYSGHADDRYLHLRGSEPLGFDELYRTLRDTPATVRVAVLDACRSGAMVAAKGGSPVPQFDIAVVDELTVHGLAVLTSSGADELSQEQRALQGSVFTHHFISALRGAADFDEDGQVTLSEAYRHAYQRTEADTAATLVPQRPAFRYELKGQGELVMSWPAKATASLVLPRAEGLRYVVVDDDEKLVVAESRSSSEHDLRVALPPGRYRVKQVLADKLAVASLTLGDGVQVKASTLEFTSRPLSAGFVKGEVLTDAVSHPRRAFWAVVASAAATGILWAVAGGMTLSVRGQYSGLPRPLTHDESQSLSGWAVTTDVAMVVTLLLAGTSVLTW